MTDGALLDRFLTRRDDGAEAAFSALVALHGPMVWNVCRSVLADPHAAADAFQATFLILVRKAASIRRKDTIGPWLYGVSRRVAVRAKATAARRRLVEGREANMRNASVPDPAQREQLEVLHQEVDRLPEKYRAPVVLCHLEGRTHAEAARLLDCPVNTISVRLARARERLKARLTRRGIALSTGAAGALLGGATAPAAMPDGLADSTINAAMRLAAGRAAAAGIISSAAAQLAEGDLQTMLINRWMMAAAGVLAMAIVGAGVGLLMADERPADDRPAPAPRAAAAAPNPAAEAEPPADLAAARERAANNFKLMGLAMHNYASVANRLPASAIRKDGKPLLSWRVAILPYIEQAELYKKFHLDEPWDSPHNMPLLKEMPGVYAPTIPNKAASGSTFCQVIAGPGALFDGEEGTKLTDVGDGLAWTLMVVEGSEPVPWTKPQDLDYDKDKPLPRFGGPFADGFHALMGDGGAFFLTKKLDEQTLRALITRNGGEPLSADNLRP